jgi:hypothetical protein
MQTPSFRYLLSALLICIPIVAGAHTGSVRGTVRDGLSKRPLEGVNIFLKEATASAVTDAFGTFMLKGIPEGGYTLYVSRIGYGMTTDSVHVEDGVTTELALKLFQSGIQLSDVTINSQREATQSSVSGLDLKLRPVNSSQDLLRLVPGLFIAQHQGGGKAEQLFLRGFDVDHGTDVAVSVDGMPVNMVSHAHGQGYADLHFLIPELVERLSFGKGPYAIDKGDFATAGWVDFSTKNYLDNSFIKAEGGTYGYFRSVAAVNLLGKEHGGNNEGAYIAGEYSYNRSYFERPQDFNRINLTGKYTRQLGPDRMFSITASGFSSSWDASGQVPERAVAAGLISRFGEIDAEGGKTSRYHLNMQYQQVLSPHSSLRMNLYAGYYAFDLYSNFTFFLKDSVNGDQIHQAERRIFGGYNAEYSNSYSAGRIRMKTSAGLGLRHDATDGSELSHTLGRSVLLNRIAYGDIHETNLYAYVNQTAYLTPQLVLTAGTRFDYFIHSYTDRLSLPEYAANSTKMPSAFSPKAGLYYNFGQTGRVYFNYGVGFHSNDTRVVVQRNPRDVLPLAHSADLGVTIKPLAKLLVAAAIFRLDLEQEFVYVGDEAVVEPSGRTRRLGADFSARYDVLPWLYADIDLNYTHGRALDEPDGANYIPLAPRFTSIGGVTYREAGKPLSASLRYRHLGDRPANEDGSVTAQGYTVLDATLSWTKPRYELGLQAQNLFNTNWNEAQFDTETRLRGEAMPVSELCFTPGTPFFLKLTAAYKF